MDIWQKLKDNRSAAGDRRIISLFANQSRFEDFSAEADGMLDARELIDFCKERMARFKAPTQVVFGPLPKTSTGKIQKFNLRASATELAEKLGNVK